MPEEILPPKKMFKKVCSVVEIIKKNLCTGELIFLGREKPLTILSITHYRHAWLLLVTRSLVFIIDVTADSVITNPTKQRNQKGLT